MECCTVAVIVGKMSAVVQRAVTSLGHFAACPQGEQNMEGGIEGQSAVAASHAMIEKILSEEPRWQGEHQLSSVGLERSVFFLCGVHPPFKAFVY